jgi:hypothetical protein
MQSQKQDRLLKRSALVEPRPAAYRLRVMYNPASFCNR